MQIALQQVGKRFSRQWIFRNISTVFEPAHTYALTGNNGSGKSTLLQMIFGYQTASEGTITYQRSGQPIAPEQVFEHTMFAAPYLDFPEELTMQELMDFHFSFKGRESNMANTEIAEKCGLSASLHKPVKYFSSGMKQRLRLGLAFFSDVPLLLLDEPCSNLDQQGIDWYRTMILSLHHKRTMIIASNQKDEYDFADQVTFIPPHS